MGPQFCCEGPPALGKAPFFPANPGAGLQGSEAPTQCMHNIRTLNKRRRASPRSPSCPPVRARRWRHGHAGLSSGTTDENQQLVPHGGPRQAQTHTHGAALRPLRGAELGGRAHQPGAARVVLSPAVLVRVCRGRSRVSLGAPAVLRGARERTAPEGLSNAR